MKKGVKTYEEQEENKFKQNIKAVYEGLNYQSKSKQELLSRLSQMEKKNTDAEETCDYIYLKADRKMREGKGVSFLKLGARIVAIAAILFFAGVLTYRVHLRLEKQKEAAVDIKEKQEQIEGQNTEQKDNSQGEDYSKDWEKEQGSSDILEKEENRKNSEESRKNNLLGKEIEIPVRVPMESLYLSGEFQLENFYLTNVVQPENQYSIDETGILWGLGDNRAGQLGQGVQGYYGEAYVDFTKEPVKIAEHVVHVDASSNYFAVYLTEDGSLYGMGANFDGLMGLKKVGSYFNHSMDVCAISPVLLMKEVAYARCGEYHILVLKKDGTVWKIGNTKDASQKPNSMGLIDWYESTQASEPKKMFEDAIYITTDSFQCAAIRSDGTLWTWGDNSKGVLGTGNYEEGTVEIPKQVATEVSMVWLGEVAFNSMVTKITYGMRPNEARLSLPQMIIQKKDGTIFGCGVGFGNYEKTVNGEVIKISATLVPATLSNKESQIKNLELGEFPLGTTYFDVIQYLKENQISYEAYDVSNKIEISHKYFGKQYACSLLEFSDSSTLETINIDFGLSPDGKIRVQSSLEEVQKAYGKENLSITRSNGSIIKQYAYPNGYLQIISRDDAVTKITINKYSILPLVIMEKLCSVEERSYQSEQDKIMGIPPIIKEFGLTNGKATLSEYREDQLVTKQYQVETIPCGLGQAVVVHRSTMTDNSSKVDQLILAVFNNNFDEVKTKVMLNTIGGTRISIMEQGVKVEYSKNPEKTLENATEEEIGKFYLTEEGWTQIP